MTNLKDIYKCNVCGHVVEVVSEGAPTLVCCDQPMEKLQAKQEDQGQEKHVPIVEETETGIKVKVGTVEHPMEDTHYIKFIEVVGENHVYRFELKPGQKPEVVIPAKKDDIVEVREFCTVHGLWKG